MTITELREKVTLAYRKLIAAQAYVMAIGVQYEQALEEQAQARREYNQAKADLAKALAGEGISSP